MLQGIRKRCEDISAVERRQMLRLMQEHYDGVREEVFLSDLAEKDGSYLLYDHQGCVKGFSTYKVSRLELRQEPVFIFFSGDTIIDREYWGTTELFRGIILLMNDLLIEKKMPLYWVLISKGVRTYLLLPLFLKAYYPNHETPIPAREQLILDAYCTEKFRGRYESRAGIIRATEKSDRMKPSIDIISPKRRLDPRVVFFLQRNPGYVRGDELACITEISYANFKPTTTRFIPGYVESTPASQ